MKSLKAKLFAGALSAALAFSSPLSAQMISAPSSTPLGFCNPTVTSATKLTISNCGLASFTATGSSTTLNVTAVSSGTILPGMPISGTGIPSGTFIVRQLAVGTGATAGGVGTYQTSQATTASAASISGGGANVNANFALFCASTAAVNFRDDGQAATTTAGSGGIIIPSGTCLPYNGTIANVSFASSSGVLGVSQYLSR